MDELDRIRTEELPKMCCADQEKNWNREWKDAIETTALLDLSYISAQATLFREESGRFHYYHSCGGRVCGRCGATIDGEPKLMCFTLLDDSEHTIEPLEGFDVIRDLVVDKSVLDARIADIDNRVMLEPVTDEAGLTPDVFDGEFYTEVGSDLLGYLERCARCGLCMSQCPALAASKENYVGPAEMVQIALKEFDWYDKSDRVAQAVSSGLYRCLECGKCDEVCMMQIPHLKTWGILKERAAERDLVPSYAQ